MAVLTYVEDDVHNIYEASLIRCAHAYTIRKAILIYSTPVMISKHKIIRDKETKDIVI